ncbi:TIGR04086 family membrane protein [Clostridium sediminicola]|uniref:TIGR04086 family membrane protein n=1 Tax=Clostridium sediminicola TaxID=3114879 RepID=UPI0031F23468
MKKRDFIYIGEGVLRGFFLTLFLILIYSILCAYIDVKEIVTSVFIVVITALGIMYGAIYAVKRIKSKGWINGLIVALIYMLAIYIISSINGRDFGISYYGLLRILLSLAVGMFSGMLGVNMD